MNTVFYSLLSAVITVIGLCPSIMAHGMIESSSCHEHVKEIEEKSECEHIDFFESTFLKTCNDIQCDEIILHGIDNERLETRQYAIVTRLVPRVLSIPPPETWLTQKQSIVLRI